MKTWSAGEVLSAADLNAEFNNIIDNAVSLISPIAGAFDFDGNTVTWDAAGATSVVSSAAVSWNFTSGSKTGTPATTGSIANWSAQTFTDNATAASGTATAFVAHGFQRPTVAATNASVTTTDAATVYIANSPAVGTNETITNAYSLWVDAGNVRFDGVTILPDGTAAAPSLKVGDEQNGLYSSGANQLGVTVGGAAAAQFRANGITVNDGTATNLSVKVGDEENGLYSPQTNNLGIATAGAQAINITAAQKVEMQGAMSVAGITTLTGAVTTVAGLTVGTVASIPDGSAAAPSLKVGDEQNGVYSPATDNLGIATAGAEAIRIDSAGQVTMPKQPAFLAYLLTTMTDITGDGTTVTIVCETEVHDQNADYNTTTGVFTAPATGKYDFSFQVYLSDLAAGHTFGRVELLTSNRTYNIGSINVGAVRDVSDDCALHGTVINADMDGADTASVRVIVSGATKVVDALGSASPHLTFFSGKLSC